MPRLRLPPLPPTKSFGKAFPRTSSFALEEGTKAVGGGTRESVRRMTLANSTIANKFVRDLGLRKNELVIDLYSSCGVLTRALLAGGYDETTPSDWAKVVDELGAENAGVKADKTLRLMHGKFDFPPWDVDTAPSTIIPAVPEDLNLPVAVIAQDPWVSALARGLGLHPDMVTPSKYERERPLTPEREESLAKADIVYQSHLQPNLLLSTKSPYYWNAAPELLSHPLVASKMEVVDPTKEGPAATQRSWDAPAPNITMVATLPDSVYGEQILNQWVSSAIGSENYPRSWIWAWGRVRLALMVPKSMYDRLLAQPGETCHGKLSVMAQSLYHIRPLPPYHHVPDADKPCKKTDTTYDPLGISTALKNKKNRQYSVAAPPPINEVTKTYSDDFLQFFSKVGGGGKENPRPPLLGVELVPRLHSVIKAEQRDLWDFLLRKAFLREITCFSDNLSKVAFGAENLMDRFSEPAGERFAGQPINPYTALPREMTNEQWLRVVDVFDKWAFKPDNLLVDITATEASREIGLS